MAGKLISSPIPQFIDIDGDPLESGYIYVGSSGLDPETNPISVFSDVALSVPVAQPVRTISGLPVNSSGSPISLFVSQDNYSITVRNKNNSLITTVLINVIPDIVSNNLKVNGSVILSGPVSAPNGFAVNTNELVLDASGNFGVGINPSSWDSGKPIEIGNLGNAIWGASNGDLYLLTNAYRNSGVFKYAVSSVRSAYVRTGAGDGSIEFGTAGLGTAGNTISFTEIARMTPTAQWLVGLQASSAGGFNAAMKAVVNTTGAFVQGFRSSLTSGNVNMIEFRDGDDVLCGSVVTDTTANTTSFNTSSDYRLKDEIKPIVDSGSKIDAFKPSSFMRKADNRQYYGFIAHEYQQVLPKSVIGEKDAVDEDGNPVYQQISATDTEMVALLVAEVQSLRKRVAALEAK